MSNSLWPHGLQHARLLCPPLSPRVCSNKFMFIEWVMPSNHLILCCPLLLLPSIFPNIRVFSNQSALRIGRPKYWASASASVSLVNIEGWFPLGLTGLISLLCEGLWRVFSNTIIQKHQMCEFKVHNVINWYHSILQNIYDNKGSKRILDLI